MKTHLDDRDVRVLQLGELVMVDWRGPVRTDAVDAVGSAIGAGSPNGVPLFMIIREACGVPSAPVRQHIKKTMTAAAGNICAHATVIDGDGILASTMRTTINAMRVLVRKRYPERTFRDPREALEWLAAESPGRSWTAYDAFTALTPSRRV